MGHEANCLKVVIYNNNNYSKTVLNPIKTYIVCVIGYVFY